MEEARRRLSLRAVLGVVALVSVAAVFWAASALAAGGGSVSGERGARDSPTAATVQNEGEAPDEDCPNRGSDSDQSSDVGV